jgi:flagellar biosynthesis/type III secretory pathway ATPase
VADHVRAILDGHIVLSRDLASRNHYPAIDILQSVSRTMPEVTSVEHRSKAGQVREWLATIRSSEDLVSVGAYVAGSNPRIDEALTRRTAIDDFLRQPADQLGDFPHAVDRLAQL